MGFDDWEDQDENVGYDGDAARKRMKEAGEGSGGGGGIQYRIGDDITRFWIGKGESFIGIILTPHMLFSVDVHRETPLPAKGSIYDSCRKTAGMGHMLYELTSTPEKPASGRAKKLSEQSEPKYEVLKRGQEGSERYVVRLPVACEQCRIQDVAYKVRKAAEAADAEGNLNQSFWDALTDDQVFCYANANRFWRFQTTPHFIMADMTGFTGDRGDQLCIGRRRMVMGTDTLTSALDNLRSSLEADYDFNLDTLVGCVVRVTRANKDKTPELGDSWVPLKAWAPREHADRIFDDKTFAKIVKAMGLPDNARYLPGRMNAKQLEALATVLGKPTAYTTDLMDADASKPVEDRWRRFLARRVQPIVPEVRWSVTEGVIRHSFDWTDLYKRVNCIQFPDRRRLNLQKKEDKTEKKDQPRNQDTTRESRNAKKEDDKEVVDF